MPELPEIETIRRGLEPILTGRRIDRVVVRERRLRMPVVPVHLHRLVGSRFLSVQRRSKYLLLETDAGRTILIHLGMAGQLWVTEVDQPRRPHEHVVISLNDGKDLRFADSRRFGMLLVIQTHSIDRHPRLRHLGPEPLDGSLTGDRLYRSTRDRTRPVKNFLIDIRSVAGVGNIYACETLHRARIDPRLPVGRIGRIRWERLVQCLRTVLAEAIAAGGTTFRDYLKANGEVGLFAVALRVYGRAGKPCLRCTGTIRRITQAGRGTFFCPRCQR